MSAAHARNLDVANLIGGGALILIGGAFALIAFGYGIGTVARMGPGFFPFATGILLAGIGLLVFVPAFFRAGHPIEPFESRTFIFIAAGIVAFALLIEALGFLPATVITAVLCTYADPSARLVPAAALALAITVSGWLIFVLLLGLPIALVRMPF